MNIFEMSDEEFEEYIKKTIDGADPEWLLQELIKCGLKVERNDNMAYSNYGAFVWRNGENITKDTCDKSNDYSGGHALLDFGEFSVEFYKTYEPIIKYKENNKVTKIECFDKKNWYNKKLGLVVEGWKLDYCENINYFELKHNGNHYLIICGSSVGNGFDKNHLSKYLLKNVTYDGETYRIKTKFDAWVGDVIENLQRKDDIDFERRTNWYFHTKPFLKQLLKFRFDKFYFDEMVESWYKIHLLK